MPDLTLVRGCFTSKATFGMLSVTDGAPICVTVERERDHNRPSTDDRPGACIPAGKYLCRRVKSPSHGDVFEVTGVPGRLYIQIHAANWSKQLRGCIAPGDTFEMLDGEDAVTSSKKALAEVMKIQEGVNQFWLTVIDAIPEDMFR